MVTVERYMYGEREGERDVNRSGLIKFKVSFGTLNGKANSLLEDLILHRTVQL